MKYFIAQLFTVLGHWFLDTASSLDVNAFEENFDGTRPFGKGE